jgi:hypothetical protein
MVFCLKKMIIIHFRQIILTRKILIKKALSHEYEKIKSKFYSNQK